MCGKKDGGCRKPENLKGKPGECTPEQIRKCHGDVEGHPCLETESCEHPEKLKGKAEECSPEQVKKCHGDVRKHPCATGGGRIRVTDR